MASRGPSLVSKRALEVAMAARRDGSASSSGTSREAVVLGKAILRTGARLGLSQKELASVIGVSPATMSRVALGSFSLEPSTKVGELALLLLRVYRGLDALVGGDDEKARAWFTAQNDHLGGVPAERIRTVEGLTDVARYLDAMRGRL